MRATQGLDDEAEALLREAREVVGTTQHRSGQLEALDALVEFLQDRGRDDEAAELDEERERLRSEAAAAA